LQYICSEKRVLEALAQHAVTQYVSFFLHKTQSFFRSKGRIFGRQRCPFSLRKTSYRTLKDMLSSDERHHISRKEHKSDDFIAHFHPLCAYSFSLSKNKVNKIIVHLLIFERFVTDINVDSTYSQKHSQR
jgi:hypothetical protein